MIIGRLIWQKILQQWINVLNNEQRQRIAGFVPSLYEYLAVAERTRLLLDRGMRRGFEVDLPH